MRLEKSTADDGRPYYSLWLEGAGATVPGDVHLPNQDDELVTLYTVEMPSQMLPEQRVLILNGDTLEQEGFSRFPRHPERLLKSTGVAHERAALKKWLDIWYDNYDHILLCPGNHEERAAKLVHDDPGFVGLGWWWPYEGLVADSRLTLLDIGYRIQVMDAVDGVLERTIYLEHGHEMKGVTGKCPSASMAEQQPGHHTYIVGHTHRAADVIHTWYRAGKREYTRVVNTGTLVDVKKNGYASQPNWQSGCAYITKEGVTLSGE